MDKPEMVFGVERIFLRCRRIGARDVIAMMDCSERLANLRFGEARHHTILDEIHLQRIEVAKEQLSANVNSIETIASICGYASPNDFSRVFKRYTGATPRQWRQQTAFIGRASCDSRKTQSGN